MTFLHFCKILVVGRSKGPFSSRWVDQHYHMLYKFWDEAMVIQEWDFKFILNSIVKNNILKRNYFNLLIGLECSSKLQVFSTFFKCDSTRGAHSLSVTMQAMLSWSE